MAKRQWTYDKDTNELTTAEGSFDLNALTEQAELFLKLYGAKQFLVDTIAGKGGEEFSDSERFELMNVKYKRLIDDECELVITPKGFSFKDPNAVAATRAPSIGESKIYDYFISKGHTEEEAINAVNEMKA